MNKKEQDKVQKWVNSLRLVRNFLIENIQYGDDWDEEIDDIQEIIDRLEGEEK